MEKYIPDMYQKSIYAIDYDKLIKRGIKCLLFDLDNTITPVKMKTPSKKTKKFFSDLKEKGFKVIIFSDSPKKRVKPFKDALDVDCAASAHKPHPKKFLQVLKEYNYSISEIAIIGDQILTDIVGGNNIGITTILVNPISPIDFIWTKFNRFREKKIIKKLEQKNIFWSNLFAYYREMNSIFILVPSIALFYVFKEWKLKYNRFINYFASISFAVYLFHESNFMRYRLWHNIFGMEFINTIPGGVFSTLIIATISFYLITAIIEFLRKNIIEKNVLKIKALNRLFNKVDNFMSLK